jgi:hypothetical protein
LKVGKTFIRGMKSTMSRELDKDILALHLGQILQEIHDLGPTEIPALLNQVAALQSALAARLLSVQKHHPSIASEDHSLTVEEAAARLGTEVTSGASIEPKERRVTVGELLDT